MGTVTIIFLIIGGISFFALMVIVLFKYAENRVRRMPRDKPLVEQHKFKMRPPTWRFQKYHPSNCPHQNGIYRVVKIKVLDDTIKKSIFVCADCVSTIESEELNHRDKFTK